MRCYVKGLALLAAALMLSFAAAGEDLVYIPLEGTDPTNSTWACARGINDAGDIVGGYVDAAGSLHGFLRDRQGNYTPLDYPGATGTFAAGINNHGEIVGIYFTGDPATRKAFRRDAGGAYTTIDIIGPNPLAEPFAVGINNGGTVVGFITDTGASGLDSGVQVASDGTSTDIVVAGAVETEPAGINDRGVISGSYFDGVLLHGFLMQSDGSTASHDFAAGSHTWLFGLNRDSVAVGAYGPVRELLNGTHGLRLNKDGTFDPIEPPFVTSSFASAINRYGHMVGCWVDSSLATHGFLAKPPQKVVKPARIP